MNLSLCMIVKNESKMLADCLESVKNIAGEMIIIDTGSTDNTVEIAKKFGAEIHNFAWTGDFSEARNESIKYAKSDWILWLDADERLNPDSIVEIISITTRKPPQAEIYKVNIKNFQQGDYYYISDAHRLFSNHQGIKFSGRIHEQVSPSLQQLSGKEYNTTIEILHHGYNLNEEEQNQKNQRNSEMLEKMIIDNPNYAYGHYTLAQNYAMSNEPENAISHFQKALDLKQLDRKMRASLHTTYAETLMKISDFDAAKSQIKKSLEIEPCQTGSYYLLYKIAEQENNFTETEKWLKKLYETNEQLKKSGKRSSTDVIIHDIKILQTLANLYAKNKKHDEFLHTCEKILVIDIDNFFANKGIANYYMDNHNFPEAMKYFIKIKNNFTTEDEAYLDVVGTIFLQHKDFENSLIIFDIIVTNNPKNETVIKKIVGILAKLGRMDEAQKLLIYFNQNKG